MTHSTAVLLTSCAAALANFLPAQVVTTDVLAASSLTAACVANGLAAQSAQPAGMLPAHGNVTAWIGDPISGPARAQISWFSSAGPELATASLNHSVYLAPTVVGTASCGPSELVVQFRATSSTPVVLQVARTTNGSVGAAFPLVALDIGNDGTIDVPSLGTTAPITLATQLTPQPLQVRIVFATQHAGPGGTFTSVGLSVRPDNGFTVVRNALGCGPWLLEPFPVFEGRGLVVAGQSPLYVFGLTTQPLLLQPSPFPTHVPWPCLLMPSPDIVVLSPQGVLVPLPATVRPLQFHVQGVAVDATNGLLTSDSFTVTAQ